MHTALNHFLFATHRSDLAHWDLFSTELALRRAPLWQPPITHQHRTTTTAYRSDEGGLGPVEVDYWKGGREKGSRIMVLVELWEMWGLEGLF